jgi:large conductance mechanosensitive channel
MSGFVKDIRDFISRGSFMEFAVGLLLALVLWPVVDSIIDDLLMPLISAMFSQADFNSLTFDVGDAHVRYGALISQLVTLVAVALAVYFGVVRPFNSWETPDRGEDKDENTSLLRQIRDALRR